MSILAHGIDLVDCKRIADVLERHGEHFLERVLTPAERDIAARFKNPVTFVAGRWAAKEAILKMLGTGWRGKILWTDMEILPDELGRPVVTLSGETARLAAEKRISRIMLSITHIKSHAAASVIGTDG
jgi:holo-[acyl-carrier protein] synthase